MIVVEDPERLPGIRGVMAVFLRIEPEADVNLVLSTRKILDLGTMCPRVVLSIPEAVEGRADELIPSAAACQMAAAGRHLIITFASSTVWMMSLPPCPTSRSSPPRPLMMPSYWVPTMVFAKLSPMNTSTNIIPNYRGNMRRIAASRASPRGFGSACAHNRFYPALLTGNVASSTSRDRHIRICVPTAVSATTNRVTAGHVCPRRRSLRHGLHALAGTCVDGSGLPAPVVDIVTSVCNKRAFRMFGCHD